ncbi:MAG TPA: GNAT family N-acetyltransferase [Anaerolineales bacterium]|nr:GNAT family N-acetyltransferase [Anaerolineales bacterium]
MTNQIGKNNIELREVLESDLPIFYEQQLDPDATQMAAFPSRDRDAFMAHWINKVMANQDAIVKTILFDDQVAGNIVSWDQSGEREVGYWIGKEYWGRGIGTKALADFLGYVKTRPLWAHVAKHNIGSQRVLQKCGFVISSEEKFVENSTEIEEFIMKLE